MIARNILYIIVLRTQSKGKILKMVKALYSGIVSHVVSTLYLAQGLLTESDKSIANCPDSII